MYSTINFEINIIIIIILLCFINIININFF